MIYKIPVCQATVKHWSSYLNQAERVVTACLSNNTSGYDRLSSVCQVLVKLRKKVSALSLRKKALGFRLRRTIAEARVGKIRLCRTREGGGVRQIKKVAGPILAVCSLAVPACA